MAILFVSPKKRQRAFLRAMIVILIGSVFVVALLIFPPTTKNSSGDSLAQQPGGSGLQIDFAVVDSDQVKNLRPFDAIGLEFSYVAKNKNGKQVAGTISASNEADAKKLLEGMGLAIVSLKQTYMGRNNPFIPYY